MSKISAWRTSSVVLRSHFLQHAAPRLGHTSFGLMSTHKVAILILCVASVFRAKCGATNELPPQRFCICDDSCEFSRDGVCDEISATTEVGAFYYEYHDNSDVRSVRCARCTDCTDCFEFYSHEYTSPEDDLVHGEYYASEGLEYYYYFDESPIPNPYEEPFAKINVADDLQYVDGYFHHVLGDQGERSAPSIHEVTYVQVAEDPPAQKQGSKSKAHTTRSSILFAVFGLVLVAFLTCSRVFACKQRDSRAKQSERGVEPFENPVENYQPRLHAAGSHSKKLLV